MPGRAGGARDDPEDTARLICLRLLGAAPRTRAQLAEALRRRGIPGGAASAVLGRLEDAGLIDDAAFARAWVESRHRGRGLARQALAAELARHGVADGQVREAVAELDPEAELATARSLAERRLAGMAGQRPRDQARRLVAMLGRKGYPAALAQQVVREVLAAGGVVLEEAEPGSW